MARTKHTDPEAIIAARRVRSPRGARSEGDRSTERRIAKALKEVGVLPGGSVVFAREGGVPRLPRIKVRKPRVGYHHPASKEDIERILEFVGEQAFYGVREIRLAQSSDAASGKLFGRLYIPGTIVLYEQPVSPWYVAGRISSKQKILFERAGAMIENSDDGMRCVIHWTENALRRYMLFEVLMHEIGHHLIQQFKGKRKARVLRTDDHEKSAEVFAAQCRKAYEESCGRNA